MVAPLCFQSLKTLNGESTHDAFNYLFGVPVISDRPEVRWIVPAIEAFNDGAAEVDGRALPFAASIASVYDEEAKPQKFAERGLDRVVSMMRC